MPAARTPAVPLPTFGVRKTHDFRAGGACTCGRARYETRAHSSFSTRTRAARRSPPPSFLSPDTINKDARAGLFIWAAKQASCGRGSEPIFRDAIPRVLSLRGLCGGTHAHCVSRIPGHKADFRLG